MNEKQLNLKISFLDENQGHSEMFLYRLVEKTLIDHITTDPFIKGLLLKNSMKEYNNLIKKKGEYNEQ